LTEIKPFQENVAHLVLYFTAQHSEGNIDLSPGTYHGGSLDRWWSNCFRDENEREEIQKIVKARGGFGEKKWGMEAYWQWYCDRPTRDGELVSSQGQGGRGI
jgi:hypothetical protein